MTAHPDLDTLYEEAKSAVAARDYERASSILQQIVVADETYKDAARLLSTVVSRQRRRWYSHPALWVGVGTIALIAAGIALAPHLPVLLPPTSTPPSTPTTGATPTRTPRPTRTSSPTPTPIPLRWSRLSMGEFLSRDVVTAVVIDPTDPDIWYVGTENAGIYKTLDGGVSWARYTTASALARLLPW